MYPAIIELAGGVSVPVNGYPDFRLDVNRLREHITDRTKMIIVNSPGNPTGVCYTEAEIQAVAELAAEKNICLVSDEIYSRFAFDGPHISPAKFNPDTIVIDGFSKSHAMTGLRVGYMHGPQELMEVMAKLQQFTFVCAPAPAQWAALTALDVDMQREIDRYRNKRDWLVNELSSYYEIAHPGGAFYAFPKLPRGSGEEFLGRAIEESLLIIPGKIFSQVDSHFRISYAVDDRTLERGIEALKKIARR
jgi:aspartate aminotransferase/aminotransferase